MTPFGHLSVSIIASKKIPNKYSVSLGYIIIGGLIPDIDFLAYLFGNLNSFHRTYTHSIGFLMICLTIIFLLNRYNNQLKNILSSFSIGFMLHLIIDASLDSNYSNGIGIPMFLPFYDGYIYWFSSFIDTTGNTVSQVSWNNPVQFVREKIFYILLIESPFYIYAIILLRKNRK